MEKKSELKPVIFLINRVEEKKNERPKNNFSRTRISYNRGHRRSWAPYKRFIRWPRND